MLPVRDRRYSAGTRVAGPQRRECILEYPARADHPGALVLVLLQDLFDCAEIKCKRFYPRMWLAY